jgi:hypothetical protein
MIGVGSGARQERGFQWERKSEAEEGHAWDRRGTFEVGLSARGLLGAVYEWLLVLCSLFFSVSVLRRRGRLGATTPPLHHPVMALGILTAGQGCGESEGVGLAVFVPAAGELQEALQVFGKAFVAEAF